MILSPQCKLCKHRHYSYESHIIKGEDIIAVLETVTFPLDTVTKVDNNVTLVTKLGRPREHISNAKRQREYRKRKTGGVPVLTEQSTR